MIRPSPTGFLHELGGPFHTGLEKANLQPTYNVRAFDAVAALSASGESETPPTAHERSASFAASAALSVSGEFFSVLERAASFAAVAAVSASGESEGGEEPARRIRFMAVGVGRGNRG